MKTWYCVTSAFYDGGAVTAAITARQEAEEKPENTFVHTEQKDIYNDWYDSLEEALIISQGTTIGFMGFGG